LASARRAHRQYEKFHGGPLFAAKQNLYRNFDFKRATGLVDRALSLPAIE
jgi:4-hydroxyphenylacetate 3-monooxygenase